MTSELQRREEQASTCLVLLCSVPMLTSTYKPAVLTGPRAKEQKRFYTYTYTYKSSEPYSLIMKAFLLSTSPELDSSFVFVRLQHPYLSRIIRFVALSLLVMIRLK